MGCGGSKFDSGAESVPAKLRPLLRRKFEEIRNRRRPGASLKSSPTGLSKKELLKDDSDIISSPSREFHGKSIVSCEDNLKVAAPVLESDETALISKDDNKAVKEAPLLRSTKVAPAPEPEKLREEKSIEGKEGMDALPTATIYAALKAIKTTVHETQEDDIARLSSITADSLCPGSPSFRVYFIESLGSIKDDDVLTNDDASISEELLVHVDNDDFSDKKSNAEDSSESRISHVDAETKKKKKARRGSRLRKVIPMGRTGAVKNLLKVKSCYNPSRAGYDNASLLANKADA